jgi:hypothetical protein
VAATTGSQSSRKDVKKKIQEPTPLCSFESAPVSVLIFKPPKTVKIFPSASSTSHGSKGNI